MKKYFFTFIGAFMIPYILLGSFIFLVDPYYVFHKPYFNMKAIQTNDPHFVARGLIRNMDYDILLCGSSMCENMHTDYISDTFGGKCLKVIQHGSYSNDFAASLKQAAKSDKAHVIIMGLDSTMWKKPSEGYRIEEIPSYAVEPPNPFNTASYVFNVNTLNPCISLLKSNCYKENIESMNQWWQIGNEAYGENNVASDWIKQKTEGQMFSEMDETLARENYSNLAEGIESCLDKGVTVKFFIPPYSIAEYSLHDYGYDLEVEKEIWRNLLQYDNVEIYAIQFDTDLIQHFEWYRNTSHYNGFVSDMIIDSIARKKYLLTTDNIDEKVDTFQQYLDDYDWEALEMSFTQQAKNE